MRVDKYIADVTDYSRNDVKKLVREKRITVNGQRIKTASYQLKESDLVELDGIKVDYVAFEYYMMNKPAEYLTATYDENYPVVMDLIQSRRKDLAPVGRLDKDAEGLLLITNDGQLNHDLLTANHHVEKTYYVEFDGELPSDAVELFSKPMVFKDFTSLPAKLEPIDAHRAYLTICEGRFHQVKRMFAKAGTTVTYLRRDRFGPLSLGELEPGEYVELSDQQVEQLRLEVK